MKAETDKDPLLHRQKRVPLVTAETDAGFGRLRPITWDEWFDNFERHQLTSVYEDKPDANGSLSPRYRIVKTDEWAGEIG